MALAQVEDVATRMGRVFDAQESKRVTALLGDAELVILASLPGALDRAEKEVDFWATMVMVECNMVGRILRNPGGYRSETAEGYGYTVDTRAAAGYLTVLKEELRMLAAEQASSIVPAARVATTPGWARLRQYRRRQQSVDW